MDAVPPDTTTSGELVFRGIGVSAGIAIGRAFLRTPPDDRVVERDISRADVAREIARFFNKRFARVFPEPENYVTKALRVPGLDGTPKMGKSEGNTIQLDHSPEEIWARLSVAVTDPARKRKTDPGNPMLCNVYGIAEIMCEAGFKTSLSLEELGRRCRTAAHGCLDCKRLVFEPIRDLVEPIRKRKAELMSDKGRLVDILREGGRKARERIAATLDEMREALGTNF